MELNKCLKERRSIRKFLKKEISWEKIVKILDAGRYAPSSGNIQNWRFIVVKGENQKKKLANACSQNFVKDSNCLIVVCSEEERMKEIYGKRGTELYSMQNCGAAVENILLEAYSLGIGSCWIGAFEDNKVRKILDIEGDTKVQAIVALGYTKEVKEPKRNKLERFIFFEKYGNKKRDIRLFKK